MAWNVWETVFYDDKANLALYDHEGFLIGPGLRLQGRWNESYDNVLRLGTSEFLELGPELRGPVETFLRLKNISHQDVDITVKVEIVSTAKTGDGGENPAHWFGVTARALRDDHWDAYLFYIRKNGGVEFGIKGQPEVRPRAVPAVASQPVTLRIRAEGDRVQTSVNDKQYHDWRDEKGEFIRKGNIYLFTYASQVKIHEVQVKAKKWYAPLRRLFNRLWKLLAALAIIATLIAFIVTVLLPIIRQLLP